MVQLKLIFLGTSSSVPTKNRGLSSLVVSRGNELILFDAGEGVQRQIIKAGLSFIKISKIFITHMHGDHVIGVLGLFQTMSMLKREKPLRVYGPRGLKKFIQYSIKYLKFGLTYPLYLYTIKEGIVLKEKEYTIKACLAEHSVKTHSYLFKELARPGIFFPRKAEKLGIPKNVWSKLQRGEIVSIDNKIVKPIDIMGPKRSGRTIGISGDTRPTVKLRKFFANADVLIFDSTYGENHIDKARDHLHSASIEAAELAEKARVKLLVLTHFSARYEDPTELVMQASKIHSNVIASHDFKALEVPYPD